MVQLLRSSSTALAIVTLACTPGFGTGSDGDDSSSSGEVGSPSSTSATTVPGTTTTGSMSASGTASTTTDTPGDTTEGSSSSESGDESSTGAPACAIDPLAPDTYVDIVLEHDGAMRSYNLYVPMGFTGDAPLPLVLNFH